MRAAKVPARIVAGYLGGERNPFGNYLIVRQSDAHVWVEVWLPKTGWTRVDPTSAVAPDRVTRGSVAALPPAERPLYLSSPYLSTLYRYWKPVQLAWYGVNNSWNLWVVGYSFRRQRQLLAGVGINGNKWRLLMVGVGIALSAAGMGLVLLFLPRIRWSLPEAEKVQKTYALFCRKVAREAIARKPQQGPSDYARQIITQRNDLAAAVQEITALYIQLRYGRGGSEADIKRLETLVKSFKPGTISRQH